MRQLLFLLCLFLVMTVHTSAETTNQIEIFHINEQKVVKKVSGNEEIQKEVEEILAHITDIYRNFEPIPHKGYMAKIPLEQPVKIENKWAQGDISEVILIFPEYENPHLMVFTVENKPLFFTFERSANRILSLLKFNPTSDNQE